MPTPPLGLFAWRVIFHASPARHSPLAYHYLGAIYSGAYRNAVEASDE